MSTSHAAGGHQSSGWLWLWLALACSGGLLTGCGSTPDMVVPPGFYRVQAGDTLSSIGKRHGVRYQQLAKWNDLAPPYQINVGSLLRVVPPSAADVAPARPTTRSSAPTNRPTASTNRPVAAGSAAAASGVAWQWPVRGEVQQRFINGDRIHQGIRIVATAGAPVRATAAGVVVYSGSGLKGYGNLIIVKHNTHFMSAYGFNRQLIAREGQKVRAGQTVAEVGQAINGEALLHFEIRRDGAAVDPLLYLPRGR